jgi:hypothetical protein
MFPPIQAVQILPQFSEESETGEDTELHPVSVISIMVIVKIYFKMNATP